jgi:hypothetical protein
MPLDLRVAIGLLLATYGAILAIHGIVKRLMVLGVNVDLWWGTAMLACGLALLVFVHGRRSR